MFVEKKSRSDHSIARTARQSTVSCFYGAPLGHLWFGLILPVVTKRITWKPSRILTSTILDNTLFASYSIATGVFLLELLKTGNAKESVDSMQNRFVGILKDSMRYWCVVSLVNHTFVPVQYKVLVGNICGIFWQIYMSYTINQEQKRDDDDGEDDDMPVSLSPSM